MSSLAALLVLAATAATEGSATTTAAYTESPRNWVFEFNGGRYLPAVDKEPGLTGTPYQDVFGSKKMWLFEGELDYELWQGFGSVSLGLAGGYGVVYGHGKVANSTDFAPDETTLRIVPLRLLASYRFDYLARHWRIPLVPFAKAGPANTIWWSTNGTGAVPSIGGGKGWGGKWGYELAAGLALELNALDPVIGQDFDRDFGVNSVFLHAQFVRLSANNFGRPGLDLSSNAWLFGLGFEF